MATEKNYPQEVSDQVSTWLREGNIGPLHIVVKRGLAERVSTDIDGLKNTTITKITALLKQRGLEGADIQVVIADTDEGYVDALMTKEAAEETARAAAKAPTVSSQALSDSTEMKPVQREAQDQTPATTEKDAQVRKGGNRVQQEETLTGAALAAKDLVRKYMRRPK